MSEQIVKSNVSLDVLLAKIASLEAKLSVKQTPIKANNQVLALPIGKVDAKCIPYLRWIPVPAVDKVTKKPIMDTNPNSKYFGRQKANFRAQQCKEIVITWANGVEVRFMKTEHSPVVHDSRTPTMVYNENHVVAELKRIIGNDDRSLKGAKWLMNVVKFQKGKENRDKNYKPLKEMPNFTPYFKLYGKKVKQPRATATAVTPESVQAEEAEAFASDSIPF